MSLILHGATVVTSLKPVRVERRDIHIAGTRIAGVADSFAIDAPVLDCSGCVVMPGLVNSHMHAYSALARGMPYRLAPPANFLEILQRVWWRLDRALDPASIRASALVAAREAVLAGTTTLIDHHASPNAIGGSLDVIARAFHAIGVRSVLAYEVSERDGAELAAEGLLENERFLRHIAGGGHPLARGMVGAHAAFTVSDETLAECARLARNAGTGVHIHVAEDGIDAGSVRRLRACDVLSSDLLAAHCVHVDRTAAEVLRDAGATFAHNARSNMNNRVGRTPLAWLGERVALGTDGIGSDMWAESQAASFRRREDDPDAPTGWFLDALAEGATLAGRRFDEPLLGQIVPGAPADLAVLDYRAPTPLDGDTLAGHWLFGMSSAQVRDVIVAGEVVVRGRRLTRIDEEEIAALASEETPRLWARIDGLPPHPFETVTKQLAGVS